MLLAAESGEQNEKLPPAAISGRDLRGEGVILVVDDDRFRPGPGGRYP